MTTEFNSPSAPLTPGVSLSDVTYNGSTGQDFIGGATGYAQTSEGRTYGGSASLAITDTQFDGGSAGRDAADFLVGAGGQLTLTNTTIDFSENSDITRFRIPFIAWTNDGSPLPLATADVEDVTVNLGSNGDSFEVMNYFHDSASLDLTIKDLTLNAGDGNDGISFSDWSNGNITRDITGVVLNGDAGDDRFSISMPAQGLIADGGTGDDYFEVAIKSNATILGGDGTDQLIIDTWNSQTETRHSPIFGINDQNQLTMADAQGNIVTVGNDIEEIMYWDEADNQITITITPGNPIQGLIDALGDGINYLLTQLGLPVSIDLTNSSGEFLTENYTNTILTVTDDSNHALGMANGIGSNFDPSMGYNADGAGQSLYGAMSIPNLSPAIEYNGLTYNGGNGIGYMGTNLGYLSLSAYGHGQGYAGASAFSTINTTYNGGAQKDDIELMVGASSIVTLDHSTFNLGNGNNSFRLLNDQFVDVDEADPDFSVFTNMTTNITVTNTMVNGGEDSDYFRLSSYNEGEDRPIDFTLSNTTFNAGNGDDWIILVTGTPTATEVFSISDNTFAAGSGNDTVTFNIANGSNNAIDLGSGNDDLFIAPAGNTHVMGGDGLDKLYLTQFAPTGDWQKNYYINNFSTISIDSINSINIVKIDAATLQVTDTTTGGTLLVDRSVETIYYGNGTVVSTSTYF